MASNRRSALGAAVLVGLALTAPGAHGVTPEQATCTRSAKLVVVDLDDVKHRHILDHVFDARRYGKPRILHIRRDEAVPNRRPSLKGIPTTKGYDRGEYPPAMSDEGERQRTCVTCAVPKTAAPAQ